MTTLNNDIAAIRRRLDEGATTFLYDEVKILFDKIKDLEKRLALMNKKHQEALEKT